MRRLLWLVATSALSAAGPPPNNAWILWLDRANAADANNQQSYRSVLEAFGYRTQVVKLAKFAGAPPDPATVLVAPRGAGARLSQKQQQEIVRRLAAGGSVIADGRQEWLQQLGFHWLGQSVSVSAVTDPAVPEVPLHWQGRDPVERFNPPNGARKLMLDRESGQPLAVAGQHGAGRYIYLAAPLDPHTPDGASHYPYFAKYLSNTFGASTSSPGPRLEAYFDPAFRVAADLDRLERFGAQRLARLRIQGRWHRFLQGRQDVQPSGGDLLLFQRELCRIRHQSSFGGK